MRKLISPHVYVALLFLGVTLLILGRMLLPGYILTLDMVWPEKLTIGWSTDGINNILPLNALLSFCGLLFPSWVVQKLMLIGLFFSLLFLPYRFLPFIQTQTSRVFAGLLYALNPFVYTRLLAGQWVVLLGYALLPVLAHALVGIAQKPNRKSGLFLAATLLLIGTCSVHFLYLSVLGTILTLGTHLFRTLRRHDYTRVFLLLRAGALAGAVFLVISMYWLAPAYLRSSPLEARFNETHFAGFSASGNDATSVTSNVAALGGFWGEGLPWRYYFVWPQDQKVFWVTAALLLALVLYGFFTMMRTTRYRFTAYYLLTIGILSYIFALGSHAGIFSMVTLWFFLHVPGWSGLRDSYKIIGVLALVYTLLAGIGFSHLTQHLKEYAPRYADFFIPALFVLPLIFGMYEWRGFHGQLIPTFYPANWHKTAALLESSPDTEKALVLPWQGYFSLPFVQQLVVANPTEVLFGKERTLTGRSIDIPNIHDQETDAAYKSLDAFLRIMDILSTEDIVRALQFFQIRYLFVVVNEKVSDQNTWLLPPLHAESVASTTIDTKEANVIQLLLRAPHETLIDSDILLYRFSY